jgi:hypothetical protein
VLDILAVLCYNGYIKLKRIKKMMLICDGKLFKTLNEATAYAKAVYNQTGVILAIDLYKGE